jgi:hypothetical protein
VNEGSIAKFTLNTTNVANGTEVGYQINGLAAEDIVGGEVNGKVTVNSNGQATISIALVADQVTEGNETLSVSVEGKSAFMNVIDTSKAGASYFLDTAAGRVSEGSPAVFLFNTSGVAGGTKYTYTLSGVNQTDILGGKLTGSFAIGSDGSAMISVPIANDKLTEGDEELTMTIQADGKRFEDKITIDDTSTSPANQSSTSTSTSTSTNTTTGTSTTKGSSSTTQSDTLSVASIVVDGLYKTSTNKFVLADAGLDVDTILDDGYIPLMSSPSKGYVAKGVVAVLNYDDGTTGLLLKSGSTYKEQLFSDVGFVKGSATKLKLPQVLAKEGTFAEDFNGDGVIGDAITTVVDGDGSTTNSATGLYKTSSGSFIFAEADLTIGDVSESSTLIMATASKPFTTTKTIVGIAEKDSGYMEILLKSGSKYSAQKVDGETGLVVGSAKTLKAVDVEAREYYYDMDLNGDMIASLVGQTAAPAGWAL